MFDLKMGQLTLDDLSQPLTLDDLRREMDGCCRCGLSQGRTNLVFGEGNPHAKLMFIGEGPGADEDRQGRPFVGAAGQLLDKILAAAGISREEVYIGNIVKCRPPGNRVPTREEADQCLPWLYRQIALVSPRIIVLLGSTALKYLIDPQARITAWRGRWIERNGIRIMPTFHPAALLRDPSKKRPVWQDIQQVRDAYRALVPAGGTGLNNRQSIK
ncbi:MAG: uracil-DNA glycosylase [Peptococcaceae bacterium]|nr:uracil-DNA glycosylase [Peptococcaceae bacterium]